MILAAIVIARNPSQYGFQFESEKIPAYEKITLPRPVDLRRIAEWTGSSIDDIQALNPELRRWTTPVRDSQYELRVPSGTASVVRARLREASAADLASLNYYTVKRGETLAVIARKLSVSRADLAEANYLESRARVSPGQKLMVPHEATVLMAVRTERTVPLAEARRTVADAGQLAVATNSNRVKAVHHVKQGDTLESIARLYKTTIASLRTWNPRLPGDRLTAGQNLTVYRLAD
jgi:membrane-bound lytic murein transglycosylase D